MAYRLKVMEPLGHGLRRVAQREIRAATDAGGSAGDARWVHETRKGIKRLRAMLRLVRDGIDDASWRHLNAELREVGRQLSERRDADVRRATLGRLVAEGDKSVQAAARRLLACLDTTAAEAGDHRGSGWRDAGGKILGSKSGSRMAGASERLAQIGQELQHLSIDDDPAVLAAGLRRGLRAGRRALADVREHATDEAFHELRKAVQLHWRHTQLLAEAAPDLMPARTLAARRLSRDLGDEHDLAVLSLWAGTLPAGPEAVVSLPDRDLIVAACEAEQERLRSKALVDAACLFALRPRAFAAEIATCWALRKAVATVAGKARSVPPAPRSIPASAAGKSSPARRKGTGAKSGLGGRKHIPGRKIPVAK